MIVQDIGDEAPVITKYRDIPSHEGNFAIIKNLHLFLIVILAVVIVDELLQVFHCLWRILVHILEFLAAVTSLMMPFAAELSVAAPHLLFFFRNVLLALVDDGLISIWSKSLLLNESVIPFSNFVDVPRHSFQVLSSQINVKKNFCVLWLSD